MSIANRHIARGHTSPSSRSPPPARHLASLLKKPWRSRFPWIVKTVLPDRARFRVSGGERFSRSDRVRGLPKTVVYLARGRLISTTSNCIHSLAVLLRTRGPRTLSDRFLRWRSATEGRNTFPKRRHWRVSSSGWRATTGGGCDDAVQRREVKLGSVFSNCRQCATHGRNRV